MRRGFDQLCLSGGVPFQRSFLLRTLSLSKGGLVFFLIAILAAPTLAQTDTRASHIPEVVVTATRTETNANEVTSSIDVVTRDEIDQHDHAMVAESLRGVTGVDV